MITLTLTLSGLVFTRGTATQLVTTPAGVARAIAQLAHPPPATPAQLGRRLAQARRRYL